MYFRRPGFALSTKESSMNKTWELPGGAENLESPLRTDFYFH